MFSIAQRTHFLQHPHPEPFDLVVIGGGITGAGIALDAASRGLTVVLLEKHDFAWGTSSRSTKLIHGGLRYLKQLEIGLVHEVGVERAIVHRNARHVVLPERMLLPIVEGGSLGKRLSSLGLWIYDRLAKVEKSERRKMLSAQQTLSDEPLLRSDILKGGGLYYEYRTDDARLTIEVLKTAVSLGAECLNYAEVTDFVYSPDNTIKGLHFKDHLSGKSFEINAKYIVNACGPWVDNLRGIDKEGVQKKRLHLTKGVHIVVPYQRLPLHQSVYFDVLTDKRMIFAVPRLGCTYIGTTDTTYTDSIDLPIAQKSDVEYILKATNAMFPNAQLTENDVLSTWAGLRPLIHQDGKSPSELSRKDEIFESHTGLISIAGGKLTGYRKMSERVVTLVCKRLGKKAACQTKDLKLMGGQFESSADFKDFIQRQTNENPAIPAEQITALAYKYGSQMELILEQSRNLAAYFNHHHEQSLHAAEVWYTVEFEAVCSLSDYLVRRTGRLYFERPTIAQWLPFWASQLAQRLQWSKEEEQRQIKDFTADYESVMQWQKGH